MIGQGFSHDLTDSVPEVDGADQARKEMSLPELTQWFNEQEENVFKMERRFRHVLKRHTRATGTVAAFLHELYALNLKHERLEVFHTYAQWDENYGFSRSNVETAVKVLRDELGVIDVRRGVGNRMYFRLFPARLLEVFYAEEDQPSSSDPLCGFSANRMRASRNQNEDFRRSHIVDREEIKEEREAAPADASAHTRKDSSSKSTKNDAVNDKRPRGGGEGPQQKAAGEGKPSRSENFVTYLSGKLEKKTDGLGLTAKERRAYIKQTDGLLEHHDLSRDELKAVARHVVDRWGAYARMPLEEALRDVRLGKHAKAKKHDPMRDGWTQEQWDLLYPSKPAWVQDDPDPDEEPDNESSTGGEEEVEITPEDLDAMFDAAPFYGARRR